MQQPAIHRCCGARAGCRCSSVRLICARNCCRAQRLRQRRWLERAHLLLWHRFRVFIARGCCCRTGGRKHPRQTMQRKTMTIGGNDQAGHGAVECISVASISAGSRAKRANRCSATPQAYALAFVPRPAARSWSFRPSRASGESFFVFCSVPSSQNATIFGKYEFLL